MRLLVGLGNPGAEYAGNRHNIGFMAIEAIAKRHNIGPFRRKFQGVSAEGRIGSERVLLLMPGTYMNESGRAVVEAMQFYKLELGDLIVLHDELDLPPGKLRVKVGGSDGGHNGLRSITEHVGPNYLRLRIGIGHPGDKARVHGYVLGDFAKSERDMFDTLIDVMADNIERAARGQDSSFMNKVHLAMEAKGFGDKTDKADDKAAK